MIWSTKSSNGRSAGGLRMTLPHGSLEGFSGELVARQPVAGLRDHDLDITCTRVWRFV